MPVGQTNRRAFIAGLSGAVAWPAVARAQQSSVPPKLGLSIPHPLLATADEVIE